LSNKFFKNNLFYVTSLGSYKYDWCLKLNKFENMKFFNVSSQEIDFYSSEFLYFNEFNSNNLISLDNEEFSIDSIINFKLQSGFLKKEFNMHTTLLDKFGKMKYNDSIFHDEAEDNNTFFENINLNENIKSEFLDFDNIDYIDDKFDNSDESDLEQAEIYNFSTVSNEEESINFLKDVDNNDFLPFFDDIYNNNNNYVYFEDLVEKDFSNVVEQKDLKFDFKVGRLKLFKTNRDILSFFIKKKVKNKTKFSKVIKNLIKKSFYDFVIHFEFSLKNILLRSQFFFNENDMNFFVKNKYIMLNNKILYNLNNFLKVGDKLNIIFDRYYFFYYRLVLSKVYKKMTKYANYTWLVDQALHNEHKQKKSHIPKWIVNLIYFREDIPNFLEVDFLTMSLVILYKPLLWELDWTKIKFLNYYHRHLYNWRFII